MGSTYGAVMTANPLGVQWLKTLAAPTQVASGIVSANFVAYITAFNAYFGAGVPYSTAGLGAALSGMYGDPSVVARYPVIAPAFATLVANTTGANAAAYAEYQVIAASGALATLTSPRIKHIVTIQTKSSR